MAKLRISIIVVWFAFGMLPQSAGADVFKSAQECVPGKRVADKGNQTGRVIDRTKGDPTGCDVLLDADGKKHYYIFWMLRDAGASAETNDKIVPGVYECFGNGKYTFMDMVITGANSYRMDSATGRFRVEPSRKIVFETGPLVKANAKLMTGPSIGLNLNGDSFFGTVCELNKTKKQ